MADTLTFTDGTTTIVVTPIPGTVRAGGGHDDRGGGTIPAARAGIAQNGSCEVVVTQATATNVQHTVAELKSIVSPVGEGNFTVTGAGRYANIKSYSALVDVAIQGDSVQTAAIEWKGTGATPSASSN